MIFYIYIITNLINGKLYVGQTSDVKRSIRNYKYPAKKDQRPIIWAIKKYGWDNFTFQIIEQWHSDDFVFH